MSNHWFAILALTLICSLPFEFTKETRAMGAMQGTASVSGLVTIKGKPAKGVAVFLQPQQRMESGNSETTPSAKTNENGYFRITVLPAGRYVPISLTPGYIMSKGWTDYTMARGVAFDIAEGEAIENFDIELTPGGVITGRVTDSNGRPLVEEQVQLWWLDKNGKTLEFSTRLIRKMLTTDDRGVYRKGGSIKGVVVIEDPTDPVMSEKIGKIICLFYNVEDMPGELRSPYYKHFQVAPNDSFKIEGTPKGRILFKTFSPNSVGSSLIRIERDGAPLPGDSIEIGAGEHISNLRLVTATPNLSLPGAIKVVGGTLPPDLGLYIYASRLDGARGDIIPFEVDARNHFIIQYLAPGEYELRLEIRDYSVKPNNVDPQLSRTISQARQKVVVSRNNQQPVIMTIDLSRGGAK